MMISRKRLVLAVRPHQVVMQMQAKLATFLNRVSEDDKDQYRGLNYIDWAKESKQIRLQIYDFGAQLKAYYLMQHKPQY